MKQLLAIKSSIFQRDSKSSRMVDHLLDHWRIHHPEHRVVIRDFGQHPLPHLDARSFEAFATNVAERTTEQRRAVRQSDALIQELRDSEFVVLGLPMYNLGIPSALKAYFDHIARAGLTFRYTENGPEGLLTGKKLLVLASRGGYYQGTVLDTQTQYIRHFFSLIGIDAVDFIYAEGLAKQQASPEQTMSLALAEIDKWVHEQAPALKAIA